MNSTSGTTIPTHVMSPEAVLLRIDSLQWPVKVLGFGSRIGIWFQGCSIGCAGCCAKHTWPSDAGKTVALDDLFRWIRSLPLAEVDGVTVSGGEPFEQPGALHQLLVGLRRDVAFIRDVDYLCYSGFSWKRLRNRHRDILIHLDAVVAEPFVESLAPQWLRGSSNQGIHLLSPLGRERYSETRERRNDLQIVSTGDSVRIVGIPNRGDLQEMERRLTEYGVTLGERSW